MAVVDGSNGVNYVGGGEFIGGGHFCGTGAAAVQEAAFAEEGGAGGGVNSAILEREKSNVSWGLCQR